MVVLLQGKNDYTHTAAHLLKNLKTKAKKSATITITIAIILFSCNAWEDYKDRYRDSIRLLNLSIRIHMAKGERNYLFLAGYPATASCEDFFRLK